MPTSLGIFVVMAGALLAFLGTMVRQTYVEFRSEELDRATQARWRIPDIRNQAVQEFLRVVQPRLPSSEQQQGSSPTGGG